MLTAQQQNTIKAHILATPELAALANIGDDTAIANWYKEIASPNYFVWRTAVSRSEVYHGITAEGTVFDWQTFKSQSVTEQNAWVQMFMGDNAPFNKLSFRNGVFSIFSGSGAQNLQRAHIFNCGRRLASRLEKLLSAVPANAGVIVVSANNGNTLASALGSSANPAFMGYEGVVTPEEIGGLR